MPRSGFGRTGVDRRKHEGVAGRNRRRSHDAANDENLVLSLWFLGVVNGSGWVGDDLICRRSDRSDLDMVRSWFRVDAAVRGSLTLKWPCGRRGSRGRDQGRSWYRLRFWRLVKGMRAIGRDHIPHGVRWGVAPTRGAGSSSRTRNMPPSALDPISGTPPSDEGVRETWIGEID